MRILSWILLLMTVTQLAGARVSNPMIRFCQAEAGQFWIVQSEWQEVPLCIFNSSAIGAEALLFYKSKQGVPLAIKAYFTSQKQDSNSSDVCSKFSAKKLEGVDSKAGFFSVCLFSDNSVIDERSLFLGPGHIETQLLDRALEATY